MLVTGLLRFSLLARGLCGPRYKACTPKLSAFPLNIIFEHYKTTIKRLGNQVICKALIIVVSCRFHIEYTQVGGGGGGEQKWEGDS